MIQRRIVTFGLLVGLCVIAAFTAHVAGQGIGDVRVTASPQHYTGPCPGHIRFTARIVVEHYPMALNYQWERSDGAKGPVKVVKVPSAATKTITTVDTWQVGTRCERGEVWEKLRVRSGNADITSDQATATVTCR